jgi:hypothetical protein
VFLHWCTLGPAESSGVSAAVHGDLSGCYGVPKQNVREVARGVEVIVACLRVS